jgi:diguanylate cyclase (GGDEF)-like protein/PAS domain S-box-containing protein
MQPLDSDALSEALKRCETEPIQYIGSVQSHGVLLALDARSTIQVVSDNFAEVFGIPAKQALKCSAPQILGAAAWDAISALTHVGNQCAPQSLELQIEFGATTLACQTQVHWAGELLVVELEIPTHSLDNNHSGNFGATDAMLGALLDDTQGIEPYAAIVADKVRALTGFDRVMVYQFDHLWNGKVIAESRQDGVVSFMGSHFPASDIPPPARALYTRNMVRILVDRDANPSPLMHAADTRDGCSLDLSFSVLRSMSPVHLEYLRNLGVRSSMSVSLMQSGRLWGLIACHHEQARQLPFNLRQSLELVARAVATRLTALEFAERTRYSDWVRNLLPKLANLDQLDDMTSGEAPLDQGLQQEVLSLVDATGAVISMQGQYMPIGVLPAREEIEKLLEWLGPRLLNGNIYFTHALAKDYPAGEAFAAIGAGMLAICLNSAMQQFVVWFRGEVVRALPWAGEATKSLVHDARGPKLEPRRSFERWVQTQIGESLPWTVHEVDAVRIVSLTMAERFFSHQQRIAATAFESQEGMMITNTSGVILRVNQAFTQITGYTAAEVVGKNPRILKSGRQSPVFYAEMWGRIRHDGSWQGEIWNRRKSGEIYPQWLSIAAVKGATGQVTNYVGTFSDITERKASAEKIEHLAFYDHLTQLPNRRLMMDRLGQSLVNVARRMRQGAVMMIDLDNFKILNDTMGHTLGDSLLVQVADRLKSSIREGDTVARLGGDEFVVILEDLAEGEAGAVRAEEVGEKILSNLAQVYLLEVSGEGAHSDRYSHFCTSSIGVTLFHDRAISEDELVQRADTAMYQAKAAGRNTLRFFDHAMQAAVKARAALEVDLRRALEQQHFCLYYQAQINSQGVVVGAEALVRWMHPVRGLITPGEFIALAEETGLILPLGLWVLNTACVQLASWSTQPDKQHLTVAVNVSARQFSLPDFVGIVNATLDGTGAPPHKLKLELTESLLVENPSEVIDKMMALKSRGVRFSMDDFGTGYSSLSYLKRLPIDQLKIDQSFVRDITNDPNDAAIAKTIVSLGQNLGISVIAEGVETLEQRRVLADLGCMVYQGYLFNRPQALDGFEAYILRQAEESEVPALQRSPGSTEKPISNTSKLLSLA